MAVKLHLSRSMTKPVPQRCFPTAWVISWQLADNDIQDSGLLASMQPNTTCIIHHLQDSHMPLTHMNRLEPVAREAKVVKCRHPLACYTCVALSFSPQSMKILCKGKLCTQSPGHQSVHKTLTTRDRTRPMAKVPVSVP